MANVNVSYDEMTTAASRLETGETDMNTKLTELQTFIQNLVTNGFVTDAASVSFGTAFTEFTSSTRKGLEALTSMGTYLRTAATRLKETDDSLTVNYG
jgi:uncharacterized protein YukE